LKKEYLGFDPERIYEHASKIVLKDLRMYNQTREIWPRLQKVIREHQSELTVTNVKTEKKTSMLDIMRDPRYTREFIVNYYGDTITNKPESGKPVDWTKASEYKG
jgi:hypothetical protein